MDQNELEEPHDDFVVEITNLPQDDEAGSSNTLRFFTETWLLSPKHRKQKTIATAICMGLALLIVLFALTPVSRLFPRGSPPTVEPSTSYFGLDANPPGDRCLSTENVLPYFPEEPIRSSVYHLVSIR